MLEQVFRAIGRSSMWLGPAGAGSGMKLVLNAWLAFLVEGTAEIRVLVGTPGGGHAGLARALGGGPLAAGLATAKPSKMDARDDSPEFALRWTLKDVDLAVAQTGHQALSAAAAIGVRWWTLVQDGLGNRDASAARHRLAAAGGGARGPGASIDRRAPGCCCRAWVSKLVAGSCAGPGHGISPRAGVNAGHRPRRALRGRPPRSQCAPPPREGDQSRSAARRRRERP